MKAVKYDHKKSMGELLNILNKKFVKDENGITIQLLPDKECQSIINAGVVSTYRRRVKRGS